MAAPADLSKLRIDRGAPPAPVKRALRRNLIIFGVAVLVVAVTLIVLRAGAVPVAQVADGDGVGRRRERAAARAARRASRPTATSSRAPRRRSRPRRRAVSPTSA